MAFSPLNEYANDHLISTIRCIIREGFKIVVILLIIEILFQMFFPRYKNLTYDHQYTGGHKLNINKDGYRGRQIPIDRNSDQLRLLAFGDSISFGTGISDQDTWVSQSIKTLKRQNDISLEVINASMPAVSLRDINYAFKHRWHLYQPDVVILQVGNNMISLGLIRQNEKASMPKNGFLVDDTSFSIFKKLKIEVNRLLHIFCMPSFLSVNTQRLALWMGLDNHDLNPDVPFGPMLAFGFKQAGISSELIEKAWEIFERDLAQLTKTVNDHGKKLYVLYIPPRFMISDSIYDNEKVVPKEKLTINPSARLKVICSKVGAIYIDSIDALRNKREKIQKNENRFEPLYILFDFMHLNETGHQTVSEVVVERILKPNINF